LIVLPRYSIVIHFHVFPFILSGNAELQLHTDVFTFHSIVAMVCVRSVRSLMAFVCQEIKELLTYLLTYLLKLYFVSTAYTTRASPILTVFNPLQLI